MSARAPNGPAPFPPSPLSNRRPPSPRPRGVAARAGAGPRPRPLPRRRARRVGPPPPSALSSPPGLHGSSRRAAPPARARGGRCRRHPRRHPAEEALLPDAVAVPHEPGLPREWRGPGRGLGGRGPQCASRPPRPCRRRTKALCSAPAALEWPLARLGWAFRSAAGEARRRAGKQAGKRAGGQRGGRPAGRRGRRALPPQPLSDNGGRVDWRRGGGSGGGWPPGLGAPSPAEVSRLRPGRSSLPGVHQAGMFWFQWGKCTGETSSEGAAESFAFWV